MRYGTVIFMSLFLLAMVAFTVKVFVTASSAYEDRIERLCAPKKISKWPQPPMEKSNVRETTREGAARAVCNT